MTEAWYKVTLPFAEAGIAGKAMALQNAFGELLIASGGVRDAAMFSNRDENYEWCFYYFSPGAVRLAKPLIDAYGGVTCPAPKRGTVDLQAGDASAFDTLLAD